MEALANARAHARVVEEGISALDAVIEQSTGVVGTDERAMLVQAAAPLKRAGAALEAAVNAAMASGAGASGSAKRQAAKNARASLETAESDTAAARAAIVSLQQASLAATSDSASPVVHAAAGVLAESERALRAARVAVRQTAGRLSLVHNKVVQGGALVVVPAVLIAILAWQAEPATGQLSSLVFATVVMVAGLLLLIATGGEHGLLGPIVGADNRVSTSKTQLGLWTIAVGFALAYLLGRVLWDGVTLETVLDDERFDEYLVLLGGPFAAGVLAKAAVTWKVERGQLQKTTALEATPTQIVQDDTGNPSLVDAQYLLFNVVALGYFVVSLVQTQVLPEIPLVLFGLTSASAATYAANKLAESNAPVITAVSPRSCLPGQRIRVSGYNLVSGSDDETSEVAVLVDGYPAELRPIPTARGTDLAVDLPADLPAGARGLTVRTPARVVAAPYLIEVLESAPILFGIRGPAKRGAEVTATGRNLVSPGHRAGSEEVGVVVGGRNVIGVATATSVSFTIPRELPTKSDVQVTLTRAGATSAPITVHVE